MYISDPVKKIAVSVKCLSFIRNSRRDLLQLSYLQMHMYISTVISTGWALHVPLATARYM